MDRVAADIVIDEVIGLKEATGDVTLGLELCNRLSDTNVSLLSGDDFTFATLMTHGFHGVISVLSNPAPADTVAWANAAKNGSSKDLARFRTQLDQCFEAIESSHSSQRG